MLKKIITYENLDGEEVSEEFLFHLSKADLVELQFSAHGDLSAYLERISKNNDTRAIYQEFKKIVLMSVGRKSEDGKRFIKNDTIRDEFASSEAFGELVMEMLQDVSAAGKFVSGIIPGTLMSTEDQNYTYEHENTVPVGPAKSEFFPPSENPTDKAQEPVKVRVLTRAEVFDMDDDELQRGLKEGTLQIGHP